MAMSYALRTARNRLHCNSFLPCLRDPATSSFSRQWFHRPAAAAGAAASPLRHRGGAAAEEASREAPEHKVRKEAQGDHGKALYEPEMKRDEAASILGTFVGIPDLKPGEVVCLDADQIHGVLEAAPHKKELERALYSHANGVSERFFNNEVYYRGIVEFSNVCQSDCGYCGIRKYQPGIHRYTMSKEEVVKAALWAYGHNYGSLMLQGGELNTESRMQYLTEVVREIREKTVAIEEEKEREAAAAAASAGESIVPKEEEKEVDDSRLEPWQRKQKGLCVALSVGEMEKEGYERLFEAGATRYLLRIETSNPELFASLHPAKQSFEHRLQCLRDLKKVGFQLGTGVMIGLPGQTLRDLANDIVFLRKEGANMIGMGPYITEPDTPVAKMWEEFFPNAVSDKKAHMEAMFDLTTRMVALARVTLGNANVTATTALQAVNPVGREIALRRGANVLMPILTPTEYREDYQLYEGKPCITDTADECRRCLGVRVSLVGKKVNPGIWADPPNFIHPVVTSATPSGARALHTNAAAASAPHRSALRPPLARSFSSTSSAAAAKPRGGAGATAAPFDIPRVNVGMFGAMNAGKSTLINCITMQETSIVDPTPGTTADTKIAMMELHDVGPVKLFDTAGIDEEGGLGSKKRAKAMSVLKECDVAILVIDPLRGRRGSVAADRAAAELVWEQSLVDLAKKRDRDIVIIFNTRKDDVAKVGLDDSGLQAVVSGLLHSLDPSGKLPHLTIDLSAKTARQTVTDLLEDRIRQRQGRVLPSIPPKYLARDAMVFLNIPMDAETPGGRLLRPQAMVQEEVLRAFGTTIAYRMDLAAARGDDPEAREAERRRFLDALGALRAHDGPKLMVTDSQAMDIVHPWTCDEKTGESLVDLTTFSIAMIQRQTDGQLPLMVEGLKKFKHLKPGERVLVAEACNHNRITELCNDIATVQIPQKMAAQNPAGGIILDHAFGREFPDLAASSADGLGQYSLAIHCGGCMVDRQKILARIADLKEAQVPVTNFGLLLSWAAAPEALWRVVEPYGLQQAS